MSDMEIFIFIERTLFFKEVQLGNSLLQCAEAGRATALKLRAERGLGLPNCLLPKMLNGSFTSRIFTFLGWK